MAAYSKLRTATTHAGACALLTLASASATAQSVGVGMQAGPAPVEAAETINDGDRLATHPYCLQTTGTRIPAKLRQVDVDKDGKPDRVDCVAANGRVYTRRDLDTTGAVDLADALRRLDPAIR